jgi:hypothetical protein
MRMKMGAEVAEKIAAASGTREVFAIAAAHGVTIAHESWYPVTIGEYERKSKTIRVNRQAVSGVGIHVHTEARIVAHELGHHFAAGLKMDRETEELFAHEFAHALLGDWDGGER